MEYEEKCGTCNKCIYDRKYVENGKNKCCTCRYMVVLEWDGWIKHCTLHDALCSTIDVEDCEE